jgi:hypothetical protein
MASLNELVGKTIIALVPFINRQRIQVLRLHGVEAGGIWVESQTLIDRLLARAGRQSPWGWDSAAFP